METAFFRYISNPSPGNFRSFVIIGKSYICPCTFAHRSLSHILKSPEAMALCVSLDVNASASLSRADATDAGTGITARSNATATVQYLYTTRSRWRVGGWRVNHGATQWRIDWCSWSMRISHCFFRLWTVNLLYIYPYAMKLDSQMVKFAMMMPVVF